MSIYLGLGTWRKTKTKKNGIHTSSKETNHLFFLFLNNEGSLFLDFLLSFKWSKNSDWKEKRNRVGSGKYVGMEKKVNCKGWWIRNTGDLIKRKKGEINIIEVKKKYGIGRGDRERKLGKNWREKGLANIAFKQDKKKSRGRERKKKKEFLQIVLFF